MTAHGGGAERRPHVVLDHVLVPVLDLAAGAERFLRDFGLASMPGGRHPGVGTANMIIPLGTTYIELIAVVAAAEAATSPRSRRIADAAARGQAFATWAVRTEDLDALRRHLAGEGHVLPAAQTGARVRPDGVRLEWLTQELAAAEEPSVLPFAIEWRVPRGARPGQADVRHPSGAGDIVAARFQASDVPAAEAALEGLVGRSLDWAVAPGSPPGLVAVALDGPSGRRWIG